jgi:hypothetical protein
MKLKMIAVAALAAALLPAAALAETPTTGDRVNASKACKELQTKLGAEVFKSTYGTNANKSNAFGKCVAGMAKAQVEARQAAVAECAAQKADPDFASKNGGKTFEQAYGTGKDGKNAMARCIAGKAQKNAAAAGKAVENAARKCKAERTSLGLADFAKKYGTSRANAFGKCVAKLASGK